MRRAKSPLAALFLTVFVDLVGFGILIPLQPYLALEFGASKSGVTGLNWAYSGAQFLMAPIWGRLSDRIGRRPVMLVSIFGSIFTQALFGATQLWHHGLPDAAGLALLYVARIGAGVCGANVATAQAYVADVTPLEGRAKGMGLIGAAFGLGFIVGPALGGGLDVVGQKLFHAQGHALPLFFAAALSLANLALAWARLPETAKRQGAPAPAHRARLRELFAALGVPGLGALLAVQFAVVWSFANMESTMALMVHDRFGWESKEVAGLFTAAGVVLVIFQGGLVGRLTARFGERTLLYAGIVFEALGMALAPHVGAPFGIYGAICWLAAGSALCSPSLSSLISRQADPHRQGSTLGFASSMSSLGRIFGPAWGGLAYDQWSYAAPYLSAAGVLGVTLVFGLIALRKLRPATTTSVSAA